MVTFFRSEEVLLATARGNGGLREILGESLSLRTCDAIVGGWDRKALAGTPPITHLSILRDSVHKLVRSTFS